MLPSGRGSDALPIRGSSNPAVLLKSERSNSVISSPELGEPLFQLNTISPQTNKTLTTVATIRRRRDRNAVTNFIVLVDCGDFLDLGVLLSDRAFDVDRAGFTGTGSLFGVASESDEIVARGSAVGSSDSKTNGSVAGVSFGSADAEMEDNTASEHHSGSISRFGNASDTASSRKTRMSLREIGLAPGKL